jgi:hypothetical protein
MKRRTFLQLFGWASATPLVAKAIEKLPNPKPALKLPERPLVVATAPMVDEVSDVSREIFDCITRSNIATHYIDQEGGYWKPWPSGWPVPWILEEFPKGVGCNFASTRISNMGPPEFITVHAVLFAGGEVWDAINGWRSKEKNGAN